MSGPSKATVDKSKEVLLGAAVIVLAPALIVFAMLWLCYAMLKSAIRK